MKKSMAEETEIKKILEIVQNLHESVSGLRETVEFMQDNMATKEDLVALKSEVFEHIDGFAQQNQTFDHELIAAQAKFNRVEERVILD